jgi:RecA/RadA recombinase
MARKKPEEKKLDALGSRFAAFKPATEVLTNVRAVPTCFIQFDHATRCGGWPLERPVIVHGPSSEGKTVFLLGIAGSFLRRDHFVQWGDAEMTTPSSWVEQLLAELIKHPKFFASRPSSYEKFVDEVRNFHRAVKAARDAEEVSIDTTALTVVDSLRKLVPENIMEKIAKFGASGDKGSVDGMGGRGAQMRAAMNAAWLDGLVPLLNECGTSWAGIGRESEKTDASDWEKKSGKDYKLQGGRSLIFDSSLVIRNTRDSWVTIGEEKLVIGERHEIAIRKTKVGGKEDKETLCYFHTSNGRTSPYGFDPARDVVEIALKLGVLSQNGSSYGWPSRDPKQRFAQGKENLVIALRDAVDDRQMLEDECRSKFETVEPEERDAA